MKKILILLGTLLIMQSVFLIADSAKDTVWTRMSHSVVRMEFSPSSNLLLTRGTHPDSENRKGVIIFVDKGDTVKFIYNSEGLEFISSQGIRDAHFSNDGRYLIVIWEYDKDNLSHGMLEIFDTDNWTSVKKFAVPDGYYTRKVTKCLISPDNSIITAITMDGFYFYDVVSGDLIKHIKDFQQDYKDNVSIYNSFYSPDGLYIYFTATDNKLRYLNTQTYHIDYSKFVRNGKMTLSKSGNFCAVDDGHTKLCIINPKTKETVLWLPVLSAGSISGMAFSPDERYLAVNFGSLNVIKVYEIETGKSIYEYTTVPSGYSLTEISISYDQKYIVSSSGYIYLYKFLPTTDIDDNPEQKEEIIYPNPTISNSITVEFNLLNSGVTKIQLYDLSGRIVKNIDNQFFEAGNHNLEIDISNLPIGQYNLTIETITGIKSHKILVSR